MQWHVNGDFKKFSVSFFYENKKNPQLLKFVLHKIERLNELPICYFEVVS